MKKCAALYNYTNLRGGNRIYPCCRFKQPLQQFDGDVENILHTKEYQTLRDTFTLDNPNCAKCKFEEELGKPSLRQWYNKQYSTDEVNLKYFEVGFDNICDLTCDGCWEEWSSAWWAKKNPDKPPKQGITHTEELYNIPSSINRVRFLGGEPLMTNRHRRFLESFESRENLRVEYFTNGMHALHEKDYELLSQCKQVHFTISIDGYGKLNDKVRGNSKWSTVLKNTKTLARQFDHTIHSTIHVNNWKGLPDMYRFTRPYNKWTTNLITYPKHLDVRNLESTQKTQLIDILNKYDIPNKQYIKAYLKGKN